MTAVGPDLPDTRRFAINEAISLHHHRYVDADDTARIDRELRATAAAIFNWLTAEPAATAEIEFDQPVTRKGDAVQIKIDAPSPLTGRIVLKDSRGNVIPDDPGTNLDDVLFSIAPEGPLALTVNDDDRSFALAIVDLGDTVLTAEVSTTSGPRTVTEALQVIPGDVAEMAFEFDTPPAPGA